MNDRLRKAFDLAYSLVDHDLTPETRAVVVAACRAGYELEIRVPNIAMGLWAGQSEEEQAALEDLRDAFRNALADVLACLDLPDAARTTAREAMRALDAYDPEVELRLEQIQDVKSGKLSEARVALAYCRLESELAALNDYREGRRDEARIGLRTVFAAIRQEADVDVDEEVAEGDELFEVGWYGLNGARLVWTCDWACELDPLLEGIVLKLSIERSGERFDLATIKTSDEDWDSYRAMCALGAEYAIAYYQIGLFKERA